MNGRLLLLGASAVSAAALLAPGAATPAGPPAPPSGVPLGPPVTLPSPAPGKAVFAVETLTGTLAAGVTSPTVTPVGSGPPPGSLRVVAGELSPTTANGKTTIQIYFAMGDVSRPALRRLALAGGGSARVDEFGTPSDWLDPPDATLAKASCGKIKGVISHLTRLRAVYSGPGDIARQMWGEALKRAKCK